jgi:hypothetical protein
MVIVLSLGWMNTIKVTAIGMKDERRRGDGFGVCAKRGAPSSPNLDDDS